jgi:hypothetical protein
MRTTIAAAALLGLLASAAAQDGARTVSLDDFEGDPAGWTAVKIDDSAGFGPDGDSKVAVTRDPQHVKAGRGALVYAYDLAPAAIRVLSIQRPKDFTGMKSLRFWVKCTSATALLAGLNETGGASYQAAAYCPAGAWQEVVLNLDEFALDDPAKDANGKLDLDEIESFHVMDLGSFLVRMIADLQGPRILWLDEVLFSAKAAPQTTGVTKSPKGAPIHLVDSFESPVIRWSPASFVVAETPRIEIFDAPLSTVAEAAPGGGRHSLRIAYTRQAARIQGLLRNLEKTDLRKATGIELSLKTRRDGTFLVSVQEKDGSRYQQMLELKSADGWKQVSAAFTALAKADDSQDENDRLDADQIKEISLADLTPLLNGGAGAGVENVLLVDEVRFTLGE